MKDLIVILILAIIIAGALIYIIRSKKKGVKCIGCPSDCSKCNSKCLPNKKY